MTGSAWDEDVLRAEIGREFSHFSPSPWDRFEERMYQVKLWRTAKANDRLAWWRTTAWGRAYHRVYQRARWAWMRKQIVAVRGCKRCGAPFQVSAAAVAKKDGRYCSRSCATKDAAKRHPYRGAMVTLAEVAARTGVREKLLQERLRRGWTLERAAKTKARQVKPKAVYEHAGETLSLAQWAKKTGLPMKLLSSRLCQGWTVEATLTTPVVAVATHELDGVSRTVREWSESSGVPYSTLVYRLGRGWDLRRAVETPVRDWGPNRPRDFAMAAE